MGGILHFRKSDAWVGGRNCAFVSLAKINTSQLCIFYSASLLHWVDNYYWVIFNFVDAISKVVKKVKPRSLGRVAENVICGRNPCFGRLSKRRTQGMRGRTGVGRRRILRLFELIYGYKQLFRKRWI